MSRVANWVWYSIGNNAMARSSFGDRRSPKTKPHDMSNGSSQYKRESGLFGLGNDAWHCTRSQPHNSDWPPFFRIEIDSILVGNQRTTPHNTWVIIREACLALAMLGTGRGPSLTTPIGAGLAEEGWWWWCWWLCRQVLASCGCCCCSRSMHPLLLSSHMTVQRAGGKATSFTLGTLSEISFTLSTLSEAIKHLSHLVLFWAIEQMMG